MYEYLNGKIVSSGNNNVVIDVNGVGYLIYVNLVDLSYFSNNIGNNCKIYTQFIPKEDGFFLYGFRNIEDRSLFNQLIKVSGVGPKIALSIQSTFDFENLKEIIQNENIDILKKIPGIGEKLAKKIVLELKSSIKKISVTLSNKKDNYENELIQAMVAMGYKEEELIKNIVKIKPLANDFSIDIKKFLKIMT